MNASKEAIFEAAANLELWPTFLPHYRFIESIERSATRNIVKMGTNYDFRILDRDQIISYYNRRKE